MWLWTWLWDGLLVLSTSCEKSATLFYTPSRHWESEDSDSVSNSLNVFRLLRGLRGFLSFFFSSDINSNTNVTLPGKYICLPIPSDTRVYFELKWNSQTGTFYVFLNLLALPVNLYLLTFSHDFSTISPALLEILTN